MLNRCSSRRLRPIASRPSVSRWDTPPYGALGQWPWSWSHLQRPLLFSASVAPSPPLSIRWRSALGRAGKMDKNIIAMHIGRLKFQWHRYAVSYAYANIYFQPDVFLAFTSLIFSICCIMTFALNVGSMAFLLKRRRKTRRLPGKGLELRLFGELSSLLGKHTIFSGEKTRHTKRYCSIS